jgi:hypothetical protein
MKKLLIALAAVIVTVATTHAQGTINFNNRFTSGSAPVDAPVELIAPGGPGPGALYSAGLYLGSGASATLIPGSITTFRDGASNPLLAKYINPVSPLEVPGMASGTANVTVEMRAWLTSAGGYDAALDNQRGTSGPLVIAELGGLNPAAINTLPSSFTGFVIVPEPSTLALGALGAAALLFRRRK